MNCETGMRDQRISSYLCSLVGVTILGFHVRQCSCWSLHTNPFSHYYISTKCTHSILDKTCAQEMLTGVHDPTLSLSMLCHAMHIRLTPNDDNHLSSRKFNYYLVPLAVYSNHLTHGSHHALEAKLVVVCWLNVAQELEHWQLKPGTSGFDSW